LLSKITDAPEEFQEAAALFLLSSVVGRKWMFRSLPETTIFGAESKTSGKLLNVWFILVGKSRITRKTHGVIKPILDIIKGFLNAQHLLTESFTPESLIQQMADKSAIFARRNNCTVCYWISDEIAWLFKSLKKKESYMEMVDALLSKMYDGITYTRSTTGRGIEQIENPYLTILAASTDYLLTLFDESQVRLGFLNRFVFVIGHREQRKPLRTNPLTEDEKKVAAEIMSFLKVLSDKQTVTFMEMTVEAKQIYDLFEEEIEKRIENENLGIKESYYGQLPNLVVRIACLY